MRAVLIFFLCAVLLGACSRPPAVLKFNDLLVAEHYRIEDALDSLSIAMARQNITGVETAHYSLQKLLASIPKVNPPDSEGADSLLLIAFGDYCADYEKALAKFVPRLKKFYALPDSLYTTKQHSLLEQEIAKFNELRANNIYRLALAQESFARRHNVLISPPQHTIGVLPPNDSVTNATGRKQVVSK